MPFAEFRAQPLELSEYPRLLASMSEPVLLAELGHISTELDVPRMRLAVEAGVFEAKPFIDMALASPLSSNALQDHWTARCAALMNIMQLASVSQEANGPGGSKYPMEFVTSDEAKAFMVEFCAHLADQSSQWRTALGYTSTDASAVAVNQAMHLACMLDRPDALKRLLKACRHAVHFMLPDDRIGGSVMSAMRSEDVVSMELTTLFTAMQFSSKACVEILLKEVGDDLMLYNKRVGSDASESISFLKSFDDVQHRGTTAAMVPVMKHFLADMAAGDDEGKMRKSLLDTLDEIFNKTSADVPSRNGNTVPAAIKAGWMNVDVKRSLAGALTHGFAEVVEHFKSEMPWDFVQSMGNMHVTKLAGRRAIELNATDAYRSLIEIAKEQGPVATAAVLNSFGSNGQMREGMATRLSRDAAGIALLPRLLDIGLDPHWKVPGDTKSLLDVAKSVDTQAAGILISHMARGKAYDLIAEIEHPKATHVPS